jgi:hypothetical protein
VEALEGHFGALRGSKSEKSKWWDPDPHQIKNMIRIRIRVKGMIWIRIKAMRIPNIACKPSISLLSSHFLPTSPIFDFSTHLSVRTSLSLFTRLFSREDYFDHRDSAMRFSTSAFFHESVSPKALFKFFKNS